MKTLVTAKVIQEKSKEGVRSIVYDKASFIVTPEARDLAKILSIELKEPMNVENERVKPQFCGVRPTFNVSDEALLLHAIKHKVKEQLNHPNISDDELTKIIEKVLLGSVYGK